MSEGSEEVLVTASASAGRRIIASVVLSALGVLLVVVASDGAIPAIWQITYVAMGAGAIYGSYRLWQATSDVLELTRSELRTSQGRVLVSMDNVRTVERGAFAFKPSNGFLVRLKTPEAKNGWAPGLWWRIGTRLGVGGVVSAGEAKAMAEIMTALITGVLPDDFEDE